MPRKNGEKTKKKILKVAEKLFSENGFDATSMDKIAKTARVNKALIYYYFKNKNDIIVSLFISIIDEFNAMVDHINGSEFSGMVDPDKISETKRIEIDFLDKRKKIISVLMMEAFKSNDKNHFLFKCADLIINHEQKELKGDSYNNGKGSMDKDLFYVFEFFTGIIPILSFVALKEKWCRYFKCDSNKALEYFLESFERTHLTAHLPSQRGNGK